jgi:hypothetical protein
VPVLWTDGRVHLGRLGPFGHLGHKDRKKTAPLIAPAAFILSPWLSLAATLVVAATATSGGRSTFSLQTKQITLAYFF